ncbi:MAG TPA: adenine phosphoribosyltransferase [Thermoanaerobaculia bacterium]|nr:adenine phosphoribosyltransferase [Thermoanaerobaculia bacterium]
MSGNHELASYIRDIPDFPKPGILFKDITPLLQSAVAMATAVEGLCGPWRDAGITRVAAIEARGFIFGACVAAALGCGFIPIRKPGKLPWDALRHEYSLEYGTDCLEIHSDAARSDDRILIVDDVLATGGTAAAAAQLVGRLGAQLTGFAFVVELGFLSGRERLEPGTIHSILKYD